MWIKNKKGHVVNFSFASQIEIIEHENRFMIIAYSPFFDIRYIVIKCRTKNGAKSFFRKIKQALKDDVKYLEL
jgi:hypothetical protein